MYLVPEKIKYNQKFEHLYYDDDKQKWILCPETKDLEHPEVMV